MEIQRVISVVQEYYPDFCRHLVTDYKALMNFRITRTG